MSSLLEQAIIDAKILKETAQKNAEAALLEKYKDKIKQNIEILLEQDDASLGADPLGGAPDISGGVDAGAEDPLAAAPAMPTDLGGTSPAPSPETKKVLDKVPPAYLGEDNLQEVELNLDSIIEKIDSLEKDLNMKTPDLSSGAHDVVPQSNPTRAPAIDGLSENVEKEEQLDEELVLDLESVSPGGINANEIELKKQYNVIKAIEAQNEELNEELNLKMQELDSMEAKLQSALTRLQETRTKLKKSTELNVSLKESFQYLSSKVKEVNLLNSRLLYTNKVLVNDSLNERQKNQIAESISKAKSVEEARTIYETLQRTAQASVQTRSAPQSLNEVLNRAPTAFLPRTQNSIDPVKDRWQRIAGIAKK